MEELIKHIKSSKGRISLTATLVAAILFAGGGMYIFQKEAEAAAIQSASDVLGTSAPSATSTHLITFTVPTSLSASDTLSITFPAGFATTSGWDFDDFDFADDGIDHTLAALSESGTTGVATSGTSVVTFEMGTAVAADSVITIEVGDNATNQSTGNSWLTNPTKSAAAGTADIYTISVGGTSDSGDILVAVVEGVDVSVTVAETLAFSIASSTKADCDTAFGTLDGPVVTASSVPFGTATTTNTFYHGCQLLTVSTNASSGYSTTIESNTSLKTGAGVLINNGTCDSTCTETATDTWATASNNGWAYSATGTDSAIDSGYKTFPCTGATTTDCLPGGGETAQSIMSNGTPVSNSTSAVEYKISISGTQAAGTYSSTVTYITTPTF